MMEVIAEVCLAFALTESEKKTETYVCATIAYTANDGCESKQQGKSTNRCNPSPRGRRDRNPGHVR